MRVMMDGTPLLGRPTGVGTYVRELADRLARLLPEELVLTAVSLRNGSRPELPRGSAWRRRPLPARLVHGVWRRSELLPAELVLGRADVFHGTNFVLPPLRRAAGVVTVHDLTYLHLPGTVTAATSAYRDLVPRSLRRAAQVVCPSRSVAEELLEHYGLPSDRVTATPLGVGSEWFDATPGDPDLRRRLRLPGQYVLFVGSREPRKNLAMLVAAWRQARASHPGTVPPLVVAGPAGWGAQPDLADVVLTGYLTRSDLRAVMAGASAFAFPSLYEGFGLPLLEAMAAGVSVMCSDLPVLREVGGSHATYLPPADTEAWADALTRIGHVSGSPSARRWASGFSWERCARSTFEVYERAMS